MEIFYNSVCTSKTKKGKFLQRTVSDSHLDPVPVLLVAERSLGGRRPERKQQPLDLQLLGVDGCVEGRRRRLRRLLHHAGGGWSREPVQRGPDDWPLRFLGLWLRNDLSGRRSFFF